MTNNQDFAEKPENKSAKMESMKREIQQFKNQV